MLEQPETVLVETDTISAMPKPSVKMVANPMPKREARQEPLREEPAMPEVIKTETAMPVYDERNLEMFPDESISVSDDGFENGSEKVYSCGVAPKTTVIIERRDALFEAVKQKIDDRQEGYFPGMSLNQLMRLESIGYQKARRVMDRIEAEYRLA